MGGEWLIFWKSQFPFPLPFNRFFLDELQLQFPFQFVSCNSGNQLTEWDQLLISVQYLIIEGYRWFFKHYYNCNICTVKITFLSRDRDLPVTVPSPSRPRSFERRPPCVPRVQRSFSVPKRPLIFYRSIAF